MAGVILSAPVLERYGDALELIRRDASHPIEPIALPDAPDARLEGDALERAEAAFFSSDLMGEHAGKFFSAVFKAPKLRWVHIFNTGTDHPIFSSLRERGVTLTNYPQAVGTTIAQTAVAGMLAISRGFGHWIRAQREHTWSPLVRGEAPVDLDRLTLVIVGVGAIGGEIARLMRPFGPRIVGVRRRAGEAREPFDEMHGIDALDALLPRADWLALACPLSDATRGLLSAERIAKLPRGARIANVGRGEVVDERALERALATGALAGAYLDVFETEPLPASSPLWDLSNVLVTPHNSAISSGAVARQAQGFLENLARYASGEALENVI